MKRIVSATLIFVFFTLLLTACSPKAPDASAILPDGPAINSVSLSEYAIVYSNKDTDYAYRAAEYLQSTIAEKTGINLPRSTYR